MKPGPASLDGLHLLAKVGPMPLDALARAMGWGRRTAFSHAERLEAEGWLGRCPRTRGLGSLLYATRSGVRFSGVTAVSVERQPAPHTWSHLDACAWTAAWLRVRDREFLGPRELLSSDEWRGELRWRERGQVRQQGHRPDFMGQLPDGRLLPVEVELTEKSRARLAAILGLFGQWITGGKAPAVMYICANDQIATRVAEESRPIGLSVERRNLRIELLTDIKEHARTEPGGQRELVRAA